MSVNRFRSGGRGASGSITAKRAEVEGVEETGPVWLGETQFLRPKAMVAVCAGRSEPQAPPSFFLSQQRVIGHPEEAGALVNGEKGGLIGEPLGFGSKPGMEPLGRPRERPVGSSPPSPGRATGRSLLRVL